MTRPLPADADLVTTFDITRGGFVIPAAIVELDDDLELRRAFARGLPDADPHAVVTTKTEAHRDGSIEVRWRRVETRTRVA